MKMYSVTDRDKRFVTLANKGVTGVTHTKKCVTCHAWPVTLT